ncbi:MAG TPA: hypothetical protein V6C78_15950 [Crinalium sp.]|jgi:hypothetical protein
MTQSNLLELAKQGDPQAIATLMNRTLQPRGMTATADLHDHCLEVILESAQVPNRQVLTTFVQKGLANLGIQSINSVKILGKQTGAASPVWVQELNLASPDLGSPATISSTADQTAAPPTSESNGSQSGAIAPDVSNTLVPPVTANGTADALMGTGVVDQPVSTDVEPSDDLLAAGSHGLNYPDHPLAEGNDLNEYDFDEAELKGTHALDFPDHPIEDEDLDADVEPAEDYLLGPDESSPAEDLFAPDQPESEPSDENYLLPDTSAAVSGATLFDEAEPLPGVQPIEDEDRTADLSDDLFGPTDDIAATSTEPLTESPSAVVTTDEPDSGVAPTELPLPESETRLPVDDPDTGLPVDRSDGGIFADAPDADVPISVPETAPAEPPEEGEVLVPVKMRASDGRETDDEEAEIEESNIPWGFLVLALVIVWILGLIGAIIWSSMKPSSQPPVLPDAAQSAPGTPAPPLADPSAAASPSAVASPTSTPTPILASPSPSASVAASPNAALGDRLPPPAIACAAPPAGATPVILSTTSFNPQPNADGDYVVGCITNKSNQAIASATIVFAGTSTRNANIAQSGTTELVFNNLQPGQSVPFRSVFTINPEVNNLKIQSISWTATGANQPQQAEINVTVTR